MILSSLFLLLHNSCTTIADPLPAKTREGRHTIGYFIENEHATYRHMNMNSDEDMVFKQIGDTIVIYDFEEHPYEQPPFFSEDIPYEHKFQLRFSKISGTDDYHFEDVSYSIDYINLIPDTNASTYYCNLDYHNKTKDIIAGSFEFKFNLEYIDSIVTTDTTIYEYYYFPVNISSGRFDLRY